VALSIGLTLVYGVLKILHIAHAGVYALGALFALTLHYFFNIWISIAIATLLASLVGVLIERLTYLPLLDRPPHVPLVVSIALYTLICEVSANVWGHYPIGFYTEIPSVSYDLFGLSVSTYQLLILVVIAPLTLILWLTINKTKIGLASRALTQDIETSQVMGINPKKVVDFNFLVGSALAGLCGALVGIYYSQVSAYMGDLAAYKALIVLVLGGLGSMVGALVGGLILGISETFLIVYFGHLLPREAFAFVVMIIFLLFRPKGLFGRSE
jgi:branched-chain amino acid transport system permease protein